MMMDFLNTEMELFKRYFFLKDVILYFLILVVFFLSFVYLIFFNEISFTPELCGDGTIEGSCSVSPPYFCSEGVLVQEVSLCGCPTELIESEENCISNYSGEIKEVILNYSLNGEKNFLTFLVDKGVSEYLSSLPRSITYGEEEVPERIDFKLMKIDNELQRSLLIPLVVEIQNLAPNSKEDQARIAISLVQNIPYLEPEEVSVLFEGNLLRVSRFPYQVLYDFAGSCEGKSELLIFLLRELGYGSSIFYYSEENHEAVGIKCPLENSLEGSGYCFVETTMPSPISYSEGRYLGLLGSNKLTSSPEIIFINEGNGFGENLEEYRDSLILTKIVNRIDGNGKINYVEKCKFDRLREKYGLLY